MRNDLKEFFKDFFGKLYKFFSNRLLPVFLVFALAMGVICAKLFELQIVNGTVYVAAPKKTYTYETNIEAPRGEIFDRNGVPLAVNEIIYTVKIDPSAKPDTDNGDLPMNQAMRKLYRLLENNGEEIIADFKISESLPHTFLFNGNDVRKIRWLKDMGVVDEKEKTEVINEVTADKAYNHLLDFFEIPEEWDEHEKYMTMSLMSAVFLQRFNLEHVIVSKNCKRETMIAVEERVYDYGGAYVDLSYLRHYPEGQYASHIIGYIGRIPAEQYAQDEGLGYRVDDLVGRDGIEKFFELNLRGSLGTRTLEIAQNGRKIGETARKEPIPGDKIYLTIDVELQKKAFHILEEKLTEILINKLDGTKDEEAIPVSAYFKSMINAGTISVDKIMASDEGDYSYEIKTYIEENTAEFDKTAKDYHKKRLDFIEKSIDSGKISMNYLFLVLHEQERISIDEDDIEKLKENLVLNIDFMKTLLSSGQITPQMTNMEPCTGSLVLQNVNTGEILAAVTYPSYDNNYFVNSFDADYYSTLLNDPTTPLRNRPFVEKRAPGSTFKMIAAIAGLETGTIRTDEKIHDYLEFTKAGRSARCYATYSHGDLTVTDALEVSCNYFFFEMAYRMGNAENGSRMQAITALNNYMSMVGLDSLTGVEVSEIENSFASPALKLNIEQSQWLDGDTIRTVIGQSLNAYTAASMSKYIATLATGGIRYQSHLLNKVESYKGELLSVFSPVQESKMNISAETLQTVYKGMLQVTGFERGTGRGTARTVFANYPIVVAGKTGTAQQSGGADHASFAGFAPFDSPEISVYVSIPRGDTKTTSAPAAHVARDVISAYFNID